MLLYRKKIYDAAVCIAMGVALTSLVIYPKESVDAAREGLALCTSVIIPSLFPFFVLSSMIVETGIARHLGRLLEPIMRPLFHVSGACAAAFVLGFVGGYPIGAKTVISLYENGSCTKVEAERLLSFCNNSGPAFIFGVVGAGVFSSSRIGLMLYLAHSIASICVGLIFRNWGKSSKRSSPSKVSPNASPGFAKAFTECVKSSFFSVENICAFVIFFTVFIRLLFVSGFIPWASNLLAALLTPLGFDSGWAERLLTGLIELTSGVWSLKGSPGITGPIAMAAFMLGWAGLSVHCQVMSFIGKSGLKVRTYLIGKLLQGIFSTLLVLLLGQLSVFEAPTGAYLAEQVTSLTTQGFLSTSVVSCLGALAIYLLLLTGAKRAASRNKFPL